MPFITLITSRKLIPRLTIYGQLASCDVLGQRLIHGLAFGAVASQPLRLVDESVVEGQIGRHLQSPTHQSTHDHAPVHARDGQVLGAGGWLTRAARRRPARVHPLDRSPMSDCRFDAGRLLFDGRPCRGVWRRGREK